MSNKKQILKITPKLCLKNLNTPNIIYKRKIHLNIWCILCLVEQS